jgi:CRISPR-associated Csh1 family protein
MIQSLYHLGLALNTSKKHEAYFASYADPFAGFDGKRQVVIIEIEDDEVLDELDIEEYQPTHARRYLYRAPKGPRGAPLVATGPFYPVHSLETEKQKEKQADNVEKIMGRIARSIPDGKSVYFSSTAAKEKGLEVIRRLLNEETGAKDTRFIYTFKIIKDGEEKYLGDFEELRELVDGEAYAKYYEKSSAKGKTCALSHAKDTEVWGRVDTLGFTVNDLSFSRGGFDVKSSYRMFPVSKPAVMMLEAGKRYAFARLSDRFYTLEYLVVPREIGGNAEATLEIVEAMGRSKHTDPLEKKNVPILKAGGLIDVIADEGEINKAGVLVDILFYQKNQAQLALQLHLQDVPPARFGEISEAINAASRRYGKAFGYENKKEKTFKTFYVNFGVVKNFFSEGKGLKIRFDPIFYRLLESIFYGESLEEETVVTALTDQIRLAFKNDDDDYHLPFHTTVYQAIATRTLLGRLGLFNHPEYFNMEDKPITLRRKEYIEEHAGFFKKTPALKGAFLLGILTSMLTYAQYDHLRSKPFLNKLNNLNMGLDELRALVPQLLNKIQQYQNRKSGYAPAHGEVTEIAAEATSLLMQGGRPSRDDLSFAFATGMVMQNKFGQDIAADKKAEKEDAS